MNKKMVIFLILTLGVSVAFAAGEFDQMNSSLEASGNAVGSAIYKARWMFALAPLAAFVAGAAWVWNDITKKAEMSQEETKIGKIFKPFMGGVAGIFVVYLLYGAFGTAFFTAGAQGPGDAANSKNVSAWNTLVTDFWINAFKGTANVSGGTNTIAP